MATSPLLTISTRPSVPSRTTEFSTDGLRGTWYIGGPYGVPTASVGTSGVGGITAVGPRCEDHPTGSVAKAVFAPSITDAMMQERMTSIRLR